MPIVAYVVRRHAEVKLVSRGNLIEHERVEPILASVTPRAFHSATCCPLPLLGVSDLFFGHVAPAEETGVFLRVRVVLQSHHYPRPLAMPAL